MTLLKFIGAIALAFAAYLTLFIFCDFDVSDMILPAGCYSAEVTFGAIIVGVICFGVSFTRSNARS